MHEFVIKLCFHFLRDCKLKVVFPNISRQLLPKNTKSLIVLLFSCK